MDADTLLTPTDGDDEIAPVRPRHLRRRRHRRVVLSAAAAAAVVVVVTLLASQMDANPTIVRSVLIGKPAPVFALESVDGGVVRSSDFVGRPYVINFWATWCVECRKEHPYLMSFYKEWAPRGVGMVGIVYDDSVGKVREFRAEMGAGESSYPDVMDPGGRTALDYGVYGVPETFVVDANGVVVAKFVGRVGPGSLENVLASLR